MTEIQRQLRTPSYWTAERDFGIIERSQKDYEGIFLNNPLFPVENYEKERQRIIRKWELSTIKLSGQSVDKDLEEISIKHEFIKTDRVRYITILNFHFTRIFDYYNEMLNDFNLGYYPSDKFNHYLERYHAAIVKNKMLGLTQHTNSIATTILTKYAEIKKNND